MKIRFRAAWLALGLMACAIGAYSQPYTCGQPLPEPQLSPAQRYQLDSQMMVSVSRLMADSTNADEIIWLGRRLGYLGRYQRAMQVFSGGIQLHPADARFYRHRGHRYITTRCFDKAIADFEKAAALVKGKPDETEPDGQPNAAGIPTSTLHQNIYYHLGLAWFCSGNLKKASAAWQRCYKASTNEDSRISAANWLYLAYRLQGKNKAASRLLATIAPNTKLLENQVYLDILLLHKNRPNPATLPVFAQSGSGADVQSATYLYGLMQYCRLNGFTEYATRARQMLLQGGQVASFGYIAAENGPQ